MLLGALGSWLSVISFLPVLGYVGPTSMHFYTDSCFFLFHFFCGKGILGGLLFPTTMIFDSYPT